MSRFDSLNRFDNRLWNRFWKLAKPYWSSSERRGAIALLVGLVLLRLAISGIVVYRNFLDRDLLNAIEDRKIEEFAHLALIYLGMLILITPVKAGQRFTQGKLGLFWRRWLTNDFLDKYFNRRAYYEINQTNQVDNPDQRISEDVNTFTRGSLSFLVIVIGEFLDLIAFLVILWSISVPLVVVVIIYAGIGTGITAWLGRRLIALYFNQLRREADFRYGLMHVRDNAESIAFYRGEAQESGQVRQRFDQAFNNFDRLINWQWNVDLVTTGYGYVDNILPIVVMAPQYFAGAIKIGVIVQAIKAFRQVLNSLSLVVDQIDQLSAFAAGVNRLSTFQEALSSPKPRVSGATFIDTAIDPAEDSPLALEHVTLSTPKQEKILFKDVSVAVQPGEGLLIMGPSGCGKSSLLRALAGLWNSGTGRLVRPKPEEVMFLPQRPYMLLGSLRLQLLYPNISTDVPDEKLYEVLEMVNLADLPDRVGGFDAELDWADVLSLGEQQRLAFTRLLLGKTRYAILDEATSALDPDNEQRLYKLLQNKGTTYISVGHRSSLLPFHQHVLEMDGCCNWRVVPATTLTAS